MSLIVEDGTGLATAESYISVADASTYHTAFGNAAWAALASDTVREQRLRKATRYMIQAFRFRWDGTRHFAAQKLDWPRLYVPIKDFGFILNYYDPDSVPTDVKNACAELAINDEIDNLMPDTTQQVLSETIGQIKTDYDKFSPQSTRYAAVEALLAPYFKGSSNSIKTVRA
jgi:hypothetical protein